MKKRLKLLLVWLITSIGLITAQTSTVTGIVLSEEDNEAIVGATILVKGTSIGTITDIDGKFSISNLPSSARTLQVSYIGMKPQEVAIKPSLTIKMKSDSELLDEVVVTGMQRVDKRLFTGATDNLSAANARLDGMADISRGLEGRSAGVSVQNVSGTFGTAPKIRVRGATSIYGSSKPLWVVDGVIMEDVVDIGADELSSGDATTLVSSAIAGLNSDDIESFQILKDGSATSIYGARAMAGVIVVTTKKGKAGTTNVNYTGEYSIRLKPSYSTFNIMNSQDQMGIYQELQQKGWLNYADVATANESGVYGKMYQLINTYNSDTGQFALMNTPEARAEYLRQAEFRNTDWFGLLFQNTLQHNHSVSISSGTEKATYYASMSAMVDPGWTESSSVQRYTANMNSTFNLSKKLSINLISNASFRKQKAPGTLGSEIDAVNGMVKRDFDINPYSYALNTSRALDPKETYTRSYAGFNIMHELDNNYMDLKVVDLRFQGEVKWKPLRNLEIGMLAALKYSATSQEHTITDFSNQAMAYRAMPTSTIRDKNNFLYKDPDNPYALPISVLPNGGIYERRDNSILGYDFRGTAGYNNVFNERHIVNLYGGMEVNNNDRHETWFRGWGMQYSMGEVPFYAYQVFKKGSEENTRYYTLYNTHARNVAFFMNATYSWKGIYTLNGTVRYEGSNKLGKTRSARWLPTWNIAGAWNVHEESFFKSIESVMSHLSLKSSYSLTAERGPYYVTNSRVVINSVTPWRPSSGVGESGLSIQDLENSELTYEKKHELNIGLEVGFLDNRINVSADWYKRDNYDLIGVATTQGMGGQVQKYGNIASMKSNGFEITLSTRNIIKKDFTWSTDFIYSHTKNEVTKLKTTKRAIDMVSGSGFAMEGYPVRGIFSIPFAGLNNEGLPTFYDKNGEITVSGIYFQESQDLNFLKYSGSADPTDLGSLGNILTYKGFRLNLFVTYSFGNVIRLDPVFRKSYSDLSSMPKEFNNRWVLPGDEDRTNIPVIASVRQNKNDTNLGVAYNSYNYSDARIAKGDFIRMKEISLGYEFPKSITEAVKVNKLSLKVQATNLFLIYADKKLNGQDPEFFNTGGVAVPVPKQFTATLRVGL